ncbi:MAG: hypothetical protein WCF04_05885, partial [Candidatus Nanopelagicales bacterium]
MADRVTIAGHTLTRRVWALLDDARRAADLPEGAARVMQGSFNASVGASAGTHDGGGAADLSIRGLTEKQQLQLVDQLCRRNGCAWIRAAKYGWTGDPHIHVIVRDEPGLSKSAAGQVAAYDRGLNGLANRRGDPHPRPKQHPMEEVRLMAWKVGARKMVKTPVGKTISVPGGQWVTVAKITLPPGASFACSLQVRMPRGVAAGEARLGRLGWGTASAGEVDDTAQ